MNSTLDNVLAQNKRLIEDMVYDYNQSCLNVARSLTRASGMPIDRHQERMRQDTIMYYFGKLTEYYGVAWEMYRKKLINISYTQIIIMDMGGLA
jgi:hypothetical protein